MKWCESNKQAESFDSQIIQAFSDSSWRMNTDWDLKLGNADVVNTNSNMPGYLRSNINRGIEKKNQARN